uniref:Uncharacterized protein n=1 Tax=Siphoviridae sp. ctCb814 TaxID=2827808 RepID=A0A8S5SP19_9CAUD|nr:MAG TPA: hypothetical protein [Siphoviridae sp. ctCb814]
MPLRVRARKEGEKGKTKKLCLSRTKRRGKNAIRSER